MSLALGYTHHQHVHEVADGTSSFVRQQRRNAKLRTDRSADCVLRRRMMPAAASAERWRQPAADPPATTVGRRRPRVVGWIIAIPIRCQFRRRVRADAD